MPHLVLGRDIVVLADRDEAGLRGAASLASTLITYAGSVRVATPPHKDLRAWIIDDGATGADLEALIEVAEVRRLRIGAVS